MPSPNRGEDAKALAIMAKLADAMQTFVLGKMSAGGEAASDFRKALNLIVKHTNQQDDTGVLNSAQRQMMMQQRQMSPQIAAMRAAQPATPGPGTPPQMAA